MAPYNGIPQFQNNPSGFAAAEKYYGGLGQNWKQPTPTISSMNQNQQQSQLAPGAPPRMGARPPGSGSYKHPSGQIYDERGNPMFPVRYDPNLGTGPYQLPQNGPTLSSSNGISMNAPYQLGGNSAEFDASQKYKPQIPGQPLQSSAFAQPGQTVINAHGIPIQTYSPQGYTGQHRPQYPGGNLPRAGGGNIPGNRFNALPNRANSAWGY